MESQHRRIKSENILRLSKQRNKSETKDDDDAPKERATITLRWRAMEHETIKYVNFVDDERPQFIFIIL